MSDLLEVRVDKPVHGGHAIARHEGRVIFVRHAAPGELVRVRLTDEGKVWRGDAVEILEPHPGRVDVPWGHAGPGGVGAELAHLDLATQHEWKTEVIHDALHRIAQLDLPVRIHPGDDGDGWHTRTRIDLTTDAEGQAGMFAHRTHTHIPLQSMPLAHPSLDALELFSTTWPAGVRLSAIAPSADAPVVLIDGLPPPGHPGTIWERVGEYEYLLDAGGFWQAHHRAPELLLAAVLEAVGDIDGGTVFDLFSGAGLFTLPLAHAVGPAGHVHSVEGSRRASTNARENLSAHPHARTHHGDVRRVLNGSALPERADVVILDPPRVGAKRGVIEQIIRRAPEKIVYVSCDPAALARDLAIAAERGYTASGIDSFDLFPHTHHIESVATLTKR